MHLHREAPSALATQKNGSNERNANLGHRERGHGEPQPQNDSHREEGRHNREKGSPKPS
jgi:hypothetical protein